MHGLRQTPAVEEPAPPSTSSEDEHELARLRVRVNYLEPIAAEVVQLRRERDERATSVRDPDDTWPADTPLREDVLLAEHERLSNLVADYRAENGELRARLWNSDAQVRDLQAALSEYKDGKLGE